MFAKVYFDGGVIMKKYMGLVAILLVALLIIPGNLAFANQFGETTNAESNSQEEIDVDEVLPSPLIPEDSILADNPDHLLVPDDSPYGGEIDYNVWPLSEFGLLAPMMLRSSTRANDPPVIGTDHPTTPGEVMLFKEAKPVAGKVNTWEVKLRIEGKNKPTTSDIVLVIDTSGSMKDSNRMEAAKAAANQFIDSLLPSDNTRIGIVAFASEVSVESNLTNNSITLKDAVNGLYANGGTFTQAGVKQAEAMLSSSDAVNKHIVLLSDGVPTYSYQLNNPDNYLIPYGDNYQTSTEAPSSSYLSDRVGTGNSMHWKYGQGGPWWNRYKKYYNHGNSAIAEAGFAKTAGDRVWTIALEVDSTGQSVLSSMASPGSYYTADPASLSTIFTEISGQIGAAAKGVAVNDPMGMGFEIPLGEITNITATQGTPTYENNKVIWNPGTLTQPISEGSDINYAELTYTIEMTNDILNQTPDTNGEYPTNGDAQISYTDADGNQQTGSFPTPKVNPVLYKVVKILQDKDGNEITADRNFSIQVKGPGNDGNNTIRKFTLNTSSQNSTKLLTDLRYASTYTFEETGDLSDYDTTYYINGGETSDLSFHIDDNNTEDVEIKVINKEKSGTLVITKVLDQSVIPSPAKSPSTRGETNPVSFSFTVTGPDGYSQNFTLPNNGSWTQTLEGLAKGSYKVTETTTGYTTTMQVNNDAPIAGNTVNVNIDIGSLSQSVKVVNKQTENMSVTATKTWEGGPTEKPDIWFQLIRVNPDDTETKIGNPKKVEGSSVTWDQADQGLAELLLRYDANGQEYSYKVQEVDAAGNDFTPENYTKVETGLNVTNTYSKKASVQVTKAWADENNQDGVRPESVKIKLLANGKDTGKTLVLTATNNWTGTFADLDEYANGEQIAYTVKEVAIGNGYVTVISGDQRTGYKVTNVRTPNPPDHPSTPTEPSEPKMPTTLPRTGESGSIYGWLEMFLLSLGLFLIMIKREFQLRKKHD
ncbi:von Willebrand factor type A domain protein [Atopobium sp. oral taxon 810 str. F0209]|nr:von Willebrand factor type A domain protein [Atopobium sp. oral taxon 810 str. F0209]